MDTFDNIIDRLDWPAGEWDNEPDRATWINETTGARCTMRRGALGSWCGYVGLNANHPLAGKDYNDVNATVHGGLTFAEYCRPSEADEWIRYRLRREQWVIEALFYPMGDAARYLRQDRRGDTSTLAGWQEWMCLYQLCHENCPHGIWWFGFDCGHAWDIMPGMTRYLRDIEFPTSGMFATTYKNFEWVKNETDQLAAALFDEKLFSNSGG